MAFGRIAARPSWWRISEFALAQAHGLSLWRVISICGAALLVLFQALAAVSRSSASNTVPATKPHPVLQFHVAFSPRQIAHTFGRGQHHGSVRWLWGIVLFVAVAARVERRR